MNHPIVQLMIARDIHADRLRTAEQARLVRTARAAHVQRSGRRRANSWLPTMSLPLRRQLELR